MVEQRVAEAAAAAAAAAASAAAAAVAEEPKAVVTDPETEKPYYEGKTIKVIANHPPGGGADLNARVVARHIGRFLPGNPKTVVLNKVGGASLVGAHYVWNASDDGLTLGVFTGVNPDRQLLQPGVQYDLLEFKKHRWAAGQAGGGLHPQGRALPPNSGCRRQGFRSHRPPVHLGPRTHLHLWLHALPGF